MELKSNINKLHFLLTESFKDVNIFEKSNVKFGNYIELVVKEKLECKIIIKKKDLESNYLSWSYLTNPSSKDPFLIERKCTIESFSDNVRDIFDNNRFDADYIKESEDERIKEYSEKEENWEELIKPGTILQDPSSGYRYKIGEKTHQDVPDNTKMFCVGEYLENKEHPKDRWTPLIVNSGKDCDCVGCKEILATDDPNIQNVEKL